MELKTLDWRIPQIPATSNARMPNRAQICFNERENRLMLGSKVEFHAITVVYRADRMKKETAEPGKERSTQCHKSQTLDTSIKVKEN